MLVFSDVWTRDEVISDSYGQQDPFGDKSLRDVAFEVQSRRVTKGNEDYGISANVDEDAEAGATADGGGDAVTVVDIVDSFGLEEYPMEKNDFKTYIKSYIGHLVKHLETHAPDRVAPFKAGVMQLVKKVLERWNDCQIYMGKSYIDYACENKAMPIIAYYDEGEVAPRFVFICDAMTSEKC